MVCTTAVVAIAGGVGDDGVGDRICIVHHTRQRVVLHGGWGGETYVRGQVQV